MSATEVAREHHELVIPTALAYVLFAKGVEKLPAPSVATLMPAEPLTAATLGVIIVGERPGAVAVLGALLVPSGLLVLAERSRKGTPAFPLRARGSSARA